MKILTKFFGEIEIESEATLAFPEGLLGFEEEKEFVVLPIEGNPVFKVLQSTNTEYVAFVIADPWCFYKEYDIQVPDESLKSIEVQNREELSVASIVTLADRLEDSTVNLLAPILVNTEKNLGKQFVLSDGAYHTKHKLGSLQAQGDQCADS